jgi:hypothetical protein
MLFIKLQLISKLMHRVNIQYVQLPNIVLVLAIYLSIIKVKI